MIGGGGERRTLALVARYADRCNVAGDLDTIRHKLAVLREHCETAGRDPASVTTTRLGSLFLVDTAPEADEIRTFLEGIGGAEFVAGCTIGTEDQIVEQVAAILDAGIDEPIFNLPLADPAGVRRVGTLLTDRFGAD
jgi:alkanesulfonate monooxygenase SsuD/methylene tetrahydromethanopterin reductase-like flavin-dependent oxidoreductase (luciferase family)